MRVKAARMEAADSKKYWMILLEVVGSLAKDLQPLLNTGEILCIYQH
jgi:hypothetical protein